MIFDFLKKITGGQKDSKQASSETKDERKAECPYCHSTLKKVPGAKTKCPHCDGFMFVRTRPDGVRLVVTQKEADKIDEQWRIENGTQEMYLAEQRRVEDRREILRKKFGREPSEHDVQWGLLNEDIINTSSNAQWGLYRNTRFEMAEILYKENKLKDALRMYLGVCYLDLNGALNMPVDENGKVIPDMDDFIKPFDPETKFLAPGVIDRIQKIIKKSDFDKNLVRELFLDYGEKEHKSTRAPLAPTVCFGELEAEIWASKD